MQHRGQHAVGPVTRTENNDRLGIGTLWAPAAFLGQSPQVTDAEHRDETDSARQRQDAHRQRPGPADAGVDDDDPERGQPDRAGQGEYLVEATEPVSPKVEVQSRAGDVEQAGRENGDHPESGVGHGRLAEPGEVGRAQAEYQARRVDTDLEADPPAQVQQGQPGDRPPPPELLGAKSLLFLHDSTA